MADTPGSSPLTPGQQEWMEQRHGVRYETVADGTHGDPFIRLAGGQLIPNSRANRRRLRKADRR